MGDLLVALIGALFKAPLEYLIFRRRPKAEGRARTKAEARTLKLADDFAQREREFEDLLRRQQQERQP